MRRRFPEEQEVPGPTMQGRRRSIPAVTRDPHEEMIESLLIRFMAGGVVVSVFAMLGDMLRPRSFAGLFSAAPSVALATVALTIHKDGKAFAAQEAKTMLLGAAAFLVYAAWVSFVLKRGRHSVLASTLALLPVWFGVSLASWLLLSGRW